jgi:hypothetical protein
MRLLPGRARGLESAVGTLILFVLIATAIGVYVTQKNVNMARFGQGQTAGESTVAKGGFNLSSFGTAEFPAAGNAETYNTDNLYEKIDGKAPMYQESGFVSLTNQRFANKTNAELGLELFLYDMGNVRNAFSVYSRQKRADVVDLADLGSLVYGYVAGNAICFSSGKYYIEMIGSSESNELVGGMKAMAKNLAEKLPPGEKDKIAELSFFPDGTVAGTWKLQLANAFGFDGLSDTYSAQYKTGDKTVAIFFSKRKNADEAKTIAKSYNDFLITNGAKSVTPSSDVLKGLNAGLLDFYGTSEIVFSTGSFVGGVHEADNRDAAQKAAEVLIEQLKKIND